MLHTSIIIATYNKFEYTRQCIESIRKYTQMESYEIIVVDNHSTDETVAWLHQQADIKKIFNEQNLGFPKACNQGIEVAKGDYILLLNNDTVVTQNWLKNLLIAFHNLDQVGAVGAVTNNCSYLQTIPVNYSTLDEMQEFARDYNKSNPVLWEERAKLIGFCMLIKKSLLEEIGLLDERFTPGNYEDDDISVRIRLAGYKLILCKDTFIHHFGSISFGKIDPNYTRLLNTNRRKFSEKWGGDPNLLFDINIRSINVIKKQTPSTSNLKVLQIGCGYGGTLLALQNAFPNARIFATESNDTAANVLGKSGSFEIVELNEIRNTVYDGFFDYVILSDPLFVDIITIERILTADGTFITQYLHLYHYSLIKKMIFGKLDNERYIAKSHSDVQELFKETTFSKISITGEVFEQMPEDDNKFIQTIKHSFGVHDLKHLEIYQFLIEASKRDEETEIKFVVNQIIKKVELEFYLRRLIDYQEQKVINVIEMLNAEQKVESLNYIALQLINFNYFENAMCYLFHAFDCNQVDSSTLFHLGLTRMLMGEYTRALGWFELLPNKTEQVVQWVKQINREIKNGL